MFWFRVLAVAKLTLLVRHHLRLVEPDERPLLARLVNEVEPAAFGRDAIVHLRGSRKAKAL